MIISVSVLKLFYAMKMNNNIKKWADIESGFRDGLIIGNGASIAVNSMFSYSSLFSEAKRLGFLNGGVKEIFLQFGSNDFELVLRHLWHSKIVFDTLGLTGETVIYVMEAYSAVRNALIKTVRATHVSYSDALPHLEYIYRFMRRFRTVLSLNYDLIVYWAAQYGNSMLGSNYYFKDCFEGDRCFSEKWEDKRQPYGGAFNPTLYFYPHGNLALVQDRNCGERKIVVDRNYDSDLLETVLNHWEGGDCIPVFVCEGLSKTKKAAINRSVYLSRVYREVIPSIRDSLVIYGWGLAEQEEHIISQVVRCKPKRIAISIRNEDKDLILRCESLFGKIGLELFYFDSDCPGVWNHPGV